MADHEEFPDPTEIRHRIGATGTFTLHNVSGDIHLRGAETDEVIVTASSGQGGTNALPLIVRRGEGSLHIELEQQAFSFFGNSVLFGRRSVEFDVTLPRGARVEINAVSSDIEARGLLGDQEYKTVSGDVSLETAGGRVALTTVSGDVSVAAEQPIEPRVATTSGDIEISAPLVRAVQLRTVSGDGAVRAAFDAGAVHTADSVSGDMSIVAASGLTVDVKRGFDLSGNGGKQRVIGDGSARLRFHSLSGDLHLSGVPGRPTAPATPTTPDSLEILHALERGEIDVEEATRRLEGAGSRG